MRVTFAQFGDDIASSRLRAKIPQKELEKLGVRPGFDMLVYGKHVITLSQAREFRVRIFDICDDHFSNPELSVYYHRHAAEADAITCNSEVMRNRIKEETGREATVIPDPYESDEGEPDIGPYLLWYGHRSNVPDLDRISPNLKYPILALSNHPSCAQWSRDAQQEALKKKCIVILPTGKNMAKSANRMVEAIRNGRYPCAEYLPAYDEFSEFFRLGDIPGHIDEVLGNRDESLRRIRAAQDYIRDRFSPETIGKQWMGVVRENY